MSNQPRSRRRGNRSGDYDDGDYCRRRPKKRIERRRRQTSFDPEEGNKNGELMDGKEQVCNGWETRGGRKRWKGLSFLRLPLNCRRKSVGRSFMAPLSSPCNGYFFPPRCKHGRENCAVDLDSAHMRREKIPRYFAVSRGRRHKTSLSSSSLLLPLHMWSLSLQR